MNKTLILYYSKYGTTKKYAEWIASALNGDMCAISDFKQNTLENYDTIIIGGGLYAGDIKGMDIILNNYQTLHGKKLVLFTCGLADYSKAENINTIAGKIEAAIPENIRRDIKLYFLRGGIDYRRLSFKHKVMMALMKMITARKMKKGGDNAGEEVKEFLEMYGKNIDFTDKDNITGIVEYCKMEKQNDK